MSKFITVYIAVILGVATYFYLRKSIRNWRERREEKQRRIPSVYYVYEYDAWFGNDTILISVHMNLSDAEESLKLLEDQTESDFTRYGIMLEDKKMFRKRRTPK